MNIMKNILKHIIILSLLISPAALWADFDDLGAGSRARGMGDSFTALADDVFGIAYNPAGLGFLQTAQVGADFGKLYFGLDDNSDLLSGFTGIAYPMIKVRTTETVVQSTASAVNISTGAAALPGMSTVVKTTSYRHLGSFAVAMKYFNLVDYYQESATYLSYGRPVSNKWAWGVSVKYLQEKYVIDQYLMASPVFEYGKKDSVTAMSVDAGLLYNISPRFFAGISVLDINQPNLGLKYEDLLPATGRFGLGWREKGMAWALDAVYRNKLWYYSTGFEKFIKDIFGVRLGVGYGGKNSLNFATGFSVNISRLQLDYAFQYPVTGIKDISGTHRMSVVFRFGRKKKEELEVGSLEYYYARAKDDVSTLSQQLAETKSEKDNLEKILVEESTLRIRERIKAAKMETRIGSQSSSTALQAGPRESKDTRHIVRSGETLQSIANKYFGDEKYWNEIYQANKDSVGRGGVLKVNQLLVIPSAGHMDTVIHPSQAGGQPPLMQITPIRSIQQSPAATGAAAPVPVKEIVPVKIVPVSVTRPEKPESAEAEVKKPAPASPSKPKKHTVRQGENLRTIAQKYYNDSNRWKDIYKANRNKITSGQVNPGQEILIP